MPVVRENELEASIENEVIHDPPFNARFPSAGEMWPEGIPKTVKRNGKDIAVIPFVYMIQGPNVVCGKMAQGLENSPIRRIFSLLFKEPDKNECNKESHYIVNKNTTWATGRNRLLEHVLEWSQKNKVVFDRFVFLDDDVLSMLTSNTHENKWGVYEKLVAQSTAPVMGFQLWCNEYALNPTLTYKCGNVDAMFNVFHRSVIGSFGIAPPYFAGLDHFDWNFSQLIINWMTMILGMHVRQFFIGHRSPLYLDMGLNKHTHKRAPHHFEMVFENFRDLFNVTSDVGSKLQKIVGGLSREKLDLWYPKSVCGTASKDYMTQRQIMTDVFFTQHLNKTHPIVTYTLNWRKRHRPVLDWINEDITTPFVPFYPCKTAQPGEIRIKAPAPVAVPSTVFSKSSMKQSTLSTTPVPSISEKEYNDWNWIGIFQLFSIIGVVVLYYRMKTKKRIN